MDEAGGGEVAGGSTSPSLDTITGPLPLDELHALRTDYRDHPVPSLGGRTFRVYALSGVARAKLVTDMAHLTTLRAEHQGDNVPPEVVEAVLLFQGRVVGASLGYPESQWEPFAATVGSDAIDSLYEVAEELSGLGAQAQAAVKARLPRPRRVASGTG